MKKALLLSSIALTIISFIDPANPLVGRWQHNLSRGGTMTANFRSNGTYDAFMNGKAFVSGKYYVRQDTFAISDNGCASEYYGMYKLTFATKDSVRFTVVQDTCGPRRRGTHGLIMSRATPAK